VRDREVIGWRPADRASISRRSSARFAISNGFGRTPFQLRVVATPRRRDTRIVPPPTGADR